MITPGDEYPLHLSSRPVRDSGTDRNLYDRFFFNAYSRDLQTYVAVALGQYPGRNVMDAAIAVVGLRADGSRVQHNLRASRILGHDRLATEVGPIRVEILEPLHRLRVVVADEASGMHADLTFTSRSAPFEEPHYRWQVGHRVLFDITRMTQNGSWSGFIEAPEIGRVEVDDTAWWGTRDRSWGIRPVGETEAQGAPEHGQIPGFYWLWAPMVFEDAGYLFDVNEMPDGRRWHESAMAVTTGGTIDDVAMGTHTYDMPYTPGTRHAAGFTCRLDLPKPWGVVDLEIQPQYPFLMQGIGYTHPTWGHGTFHGALATEHDSYDIADADGTVVVDERQYVHQHIQALSKVRRGDGAEGVGILEQLIIGPHAPSGLKGLLDFPS